MVDTFPTIQFVLRLALALMFVGMGISHFLPGPARAMAAMIPPALRRSGILAPKNLVIFTGLCEIAGGVGMLVPQTRFVAGIALVLFLIAVFPANSYAAKHPEKFGRAAFPFWPRFIGQVVLIALVLLAVI